MARRSLNALIFTFVLTVTLTGCGGGKEADQLSQSAKKTQPPMGMTKEQKRNQLVNQFWNLRKQRMARMKAELAGDSGFVAANKAWEDGIVRLGAINSDFKKNVAQNDIRRAKYNAAQKNFADFSAVSPDVIKKMSKEQRASRNKELKLLQGQVAALKKDVEALPTSDQLVKGKNEALLAVSRQQDKAFLDMCKAYLQKGGAEVLRKELAMANEIVLLEQQMNKRTFHARTCDPAKSQLVKF